MIDFHCHLDLFPNAAAIASDPRLDDIGVLSVTTTPSAWQGTLRLEDGRRAIRTALGLHPQLASQRKHEMKLFERYFEDTSFIGEVGLDGSPELRSTWDDQVEVFESILHMCALVGDRVLSIHSRRAASPVLDALAEHQNSSRAILHWFSGTASELRRAIDLGCWFSVGPAMLEGAKGRALAAAMPRDRVVLETDGPFASVRGAPLQPWDVQLAARMLRGVWDEPLDAVAAQIRANERDLLRHG